MIKKNNKKLENLYPILSNIGGENYLRVKSSLDTLININKLIDTYINTEKKVEGEILISIFGLLQSLFVSIDSLYQLSYGITDSKWSVNVNLNPSLREIKYIRNDCVGHPTKRIYDDNKIGFCDLDLEKTDYDTLVYRIYMYEDDKQVITSHNIELRSLIDNFYMESNSILTDIYQRSTNSSKTDVYLSKLTYDIYKNFVRGIKSYQEINQLRNTYAKAYNLSESSSNDRFLWRCTLVYEMLKWDEQDHSELTKYLVTKAIKKLYDMATEFDYKKNDSYYYDTAFRFKEPKGIREARFFINNNKKISAIDHLNDNSWPQFTTNIKRIRNMAINKNDVVRVLDVLLKNASNGYRVFMLGGCLIEKQV